MIQEEAKRLAIGMLPLVVLTILGFAVCRQLTWDVGLTLLAGTVYAFGLFLMIGASAAKAVLYPPERAVAIVRRGYMIRYFLTGTLLVLVFQSSFLNPVAAILPLFYPKIVLLANSIFSKKGG